MTEHVPEPQGDWRPRPDPTALTTEALQREIATLKELLYVELARLLKTVEDQKDLHDRVFAERDARYSERFEASEDAVKVALREARDSSAKAVSSQKEAVDAAFEASEKAISKAEVSIERRAEVTFVKVEELQKTLGTLPTKSEIEQRFLDIRDRIESMGSRLTTIEAAKSGASEQRASMSDGTRLAIAVGTFVLLALGFVAARGGL